MKKITMNVKDAESLVEYISVLIEAIDVEDEDTLSYIDEGYNNFVQPFLDAIQIAKENNGIQETSSKWAEVRNDFIDEFEGKCYIDAWETDDHNEEGRVIAKIDINTKTVEYLDEDAETDKYAQEVIAEAIALFEKENEEEQNYE